MLAVGTLAREGHMTVTIGRRQLIAVLGGAAVLPLAARAQQPGEEPEGDLRPVDRLQTPS
jgi:hypothetical protein